jgi:hypothetical protein
MQLQRYLSLLLLALICLSVQGFHEEPSDAVREHIKNVITDEDVQVMQAEMAWGVQEMQRYKTIRGNWPVRSPLTGQEEAPPEDRSLFRGANNTPHNQSAHHEYWNYLIAMF